MAIHCSDRFAYRVLRFVETRGERGVSCGDLGDELYPRTKSTRKNISCSQLLRALAGRGLLAILGQQSRTSAALYIVTDEGRTYLANELQGARDAARARHAAHRERTAQGATGSAPESPGAFPWTPDVAELPDGFSSLPGSGAPR